MWLIAPPRTTTALAACLALAFAAAKGDVVQETAREIPVAFDVDVAVVGGSSGAVSAAEAAAEAGASVFLAAPRPYLGDDLCGPLRLWLEPGEKPADPLAEAIFAQPGPVRPMHVKRTLDQAMLQAGAAFLFSSPATDVLRDSRGQIAGVVIANRAGRQAVQAKVLIDATARACVARMAGARCQPYPPGRHAFRWVVIGGARQSGEGIQLRASNVRIPAGKEVHPVFEYSLSLPVRDASLRSFAEAEQSARDMTFHPGQVDASEFLDQLPPDPVVGRASLAGDWTGAEAANLDAFRPAGVEFLYVLGGCADMPRPAAERLQRPVALMAMGRRIGHAAAADAKARGPLAGLRLTGAAPAAAERGEIRERLRGPRSVSAGLPTVPAEERGVPVLGRYDVVVVGGGTGGAAAAIGAARLGARTLVIEYLHSLGGVGTVGMLGKYTYGRRVGFTEELDREMEALGARVKILGKAECWRRELRKAGAEIWLGCLACGALVDGRKVKGVVVAAPQGRGVVLANVIIDSTGSADVALAAGAECASDPQSLLGIQGAGIAQRDLGVSVVCPDYTVADDNDVIDAWHHVVYAKSKYAGAYDLAQLVDTRERRRVVGDLFLTPLDILTARTYADSISLHAAYFDYHGFKTHAVFLLQPPGRMQAQGYVSYRCLLPRGLDGILVTGLGISAHQDAMALLRMQADIQNQGYAAGVAAAMATRGGKGLRDIDVRALQRHLVDKGCLPESVLRDADSHPAHAQRVAAAVRSFISSDGSVEERLSQLGIILAGREESLPLLRSAHADSRSEKERRRCAHVLGMLGDATGIETLIAAVRGFEGFDQGDALRPRGDVAISELDSLIIALGRTRDRRAVPAVIDKLKLVRGDTQLSHIRAVAEALSELGDPAAAETLAWVMTRHQAHVDGKPVTMCGHAIRDVAEAARRAGPGGEDLRARALSVRELLLATALFRCGDWRGLAREILNDYCHDLRGPLAEYAAYVLQPASAAGPRF